MEECTGMPAREMRLSSSIAKREALPTSHWFVARRDQPNSSHGDVVTIAKHDPEVSEIDRHTNAEIMTASFNCKDLKESRIVGSLYRLTDK